MTTYGDVDELCTACGESSRQFAMLSSWGAESLGGPERSLDTRPYDANRLRLLVQMCPHCGYCAKSISAEVEPVPDVIRSPAYLAIVNQAEVSPLARTFLGQAAISIDKGDLADAAWQSHCAAWACDDERCLRSADQCRKQTIRNYLAARKLVCVSGIAMVRN